MGRAAGKGRRNPIKRWFGKARLFRLASRLKISLWALPALCVVGALALFWAADTVDHLLEIDTAFFLFQGGPAGAREILSTVASSMLTFTGLVFSITILVLQLASNQFSPRVLRTFLSDRHSQVAVGLFAATFVYALLGLRTVRGTAETDQSYVPAFTVWLAIVLAMANVLAFVAYLHHVAQSIRAVNVVGRIGAESRKSLAHLYPEGVGDDVEEVGGQAPIDSPSLLVAYRGRPGVIVQVDEEGLLSLAQDGGVALGLVPRIGDFIGYGSVLFQVWGDAGSFDAEAAVDAVTVDAERTVDQDLGFGFRQLVDIAERALSPGVNDPTTAVQALDQLHDLLRRLATRRFPSPCRFDRDCRLRLRLPRPDWTDYVRLAVDEVRLAGADSLQIARRLRFLIDDLLSVAPPFRHGELLRQSALLDEGDRRGFVDRRDREVARLGSPQGHGPPH